MFQTGGESMVWDNAKHEWNVKLNQSAKGGQATKVHINADFVVITPGLLHKAKIPDIEGIGTFKGHAFHTSRWDYDYTGGSPEKPELRNLKDKKVAIIGTGATAVQCVPELAKYAKELCVFQRTPSSIDVRDNRDTDPEEWKSRIASKEGWQRERQLNFQAFLNNLEPKPEVDLVDDMWSKAPSYSALLGTYKPVTMESVAQHIGELHALDYPRTERIRQRAAELVKDQKTAASLQAWYPTWCKRPCFHDEYLQSFNLPSVKLVDTEGAGIDRITEKGIQFKGQEYDFDLIVWSTGFRSPALGSAAGKADMDVIGKNGKSMEQVNNEGGLSTLHGIASNGFPNVFWSGPLQAGTAAYVPLEPPFDHGCRAVTDRQLQEQHLHHRRPRHARRVHHGRSREARARRRKSRRRAHDRSAGSVGHADSHGCCDVRCHFRYVIDTPSPPSPINPTTLLADTPPPTLSLRLHTLLHKRRRRARPPADGAADGGGEVRPVAAWLREFRGDAGGVEDGGRDAGDEC